jgi:putative transposase
MELSHRIALDPTVRQKEYFARACGTARFVWNWALAEWNAQYGLGGKPRATELKRLFNAIKYQRFPWLNGVHRDAHAQPFANLNKAFRNFFKGRAKRPQFKKKGKCRDSFYVANDKFSVDGRTVRLPLIGRVKMTEELRFAGKIQSAVVSREADRWFVSISVEVAGAVLMPVRGEPVGVDFGVTTFATLSTGEKIAAPKPLKKALRKLRRLGRWHSRKALKSQNRRKAALKLSRLHRRIKNVRQDFIHKFTTQLVRQHGLICVEDLNVQGMVKNHNLALHISDAGWSEARRQLEYKAKFYNSSVIVCDRWYASSKTCSVCGCRAAAMPLSVRQWTCAECGTSHDRDVNAAINLKNNTVGFTGIYASGDCGAGVRLAGHETAVVERGTLPRAFIGAQER